MKKELYLMTLALVGSFAMHAQTKIKDGSATSGSMPHTLAVLDLESNNKGLLLPRLSTLQRNSMTAVPEGMVIFNTTDSCINQYNRGAWNSLCEVDDFCELVMVGDGSDSTFLYTDPNSPGGIFEPADPQSSCALYVTEDGRTWRWNSTSNAYVLRNDVYVEPWWNRVSNKPSRSLTDHLYHLGSANVGTGFASGAYSMSIGSRDTVAAAYALAVGANNTISSAASNAIVVGNNNKLSGTLSAVFGVSNVDSARWSFVSGGNNSLGAGQFYSAVIGRQNILSGTGSQNYILGMQDTIDAASLNLITGDRNKISQSNRNFLSGYGNLVSGGSGNNIAIGQSHTLIGGGYSAIFGNTNKDSSFYNFIAGTNQVIRAASNYSVILGGTGNTIRGAQSLAYGSGNDVLAQYGYAIGRNNTVTHQNAMVLGESAATTANNQLVLGFSNGVVLPKAASAPANPVEGQLYFNTTSKIAFVWNGTEWKALY